MTRPIELVYDRLVASERLKSGTAYERLAAIVFFILTEQTTVHDLRLVGDVGVAHQIDVVVGPERKRLLIEAKDYERNVSLPVVRDFSAVVEDLRPDEAFVVTTVGFSDRAQKWAKAKGLRLAILRPPADDADWGRILQRIDVRMNMAAGGDPTMEWQVDRSEAERFADGANPIGWRHVDDLSTGPLDGPRTPLRELLEPQIEAVVAGHPAGTAGEYGGAHDFDEPTWLHVSGTEPVKVNGYKWTQKVAVAVREFSIGYGFGDLTAELVLRTIDGSLHRIFSNRQIEAFEFDGKVVKPKAQSSS